MKKYYVNWEEVDETHLNTEMRKALKKEFSSNDHKFIKELMTENKKSLNEVGRNNINGVEFEVMYVAMSFDEKFELYLDLPFIEFLNTLKDEKEITLSDYERYEKELWALEDEEYCDDKNSFKLEILDELEMYEDLFMDYQKRMGNL